MIRYYKLFDLLMRKGMKKTDLLQVISAPTLAKLSKGETVKTDTIDKICLFLECQPNEIMEVFEEIEYTDSKGNVRKIKRKLENIDELDLIQLEELEKRKKQYDEIKKEMENKE